MSKLYIMNHIRYQLSKFMNRGIKSQIILFGVLTLVCILLISVFYSFLDPSLNKIDVFWNVTTWMLDAGTYADNTGALDRFFSFFTTIIGILLMSSLIGLLSAFILDYILKLRKGIGSIRAENYTLIIGWNFRVFKLLSELIIANENQKSHTIVILSNMDKLLMDHEINMNLKVPRKIKIITRRIQPLLYNSYNIIDLNLAKSIILLSEASIINEINMLKLLLVVDKITDNLKIPVIFEIENEKNKNVLKPLLKENYYPVFKEAIFSKAISQTVIQPGLTKVYSELFSFEESEIYIQKLPLEFIGKPFSDAYLSIINSSLIGVFDINSNTILNPDKSRLFVDSDELILIKKDDYRLIIENTSSNQDIASLALSDYIEIKIKNILILGWNSYSLNIIKEISKYINFEVQFTIIADKEYIENELIINMSKLSKINYNIINEDHFNFEALSKLDFELFDRVLIMRCERFAIEESDAIAISTMIYLKECFKKLTDPPAITLQIEVEKNQDLIENDTISEYVISDSLISGIISQLSENQKINNSILELINEWGNEIYFVEINKLLQTNEQKIKSKDLYNLALKLDSCLIGVKLNSLNSYEILLNPHKDNFSNFSLNDELILIGDY
jgi:hypothetical protein